MFFNYIISDSTLPIIVLGIIIIILFFLAIYKNIKKIKQSYNKQQKIYIYLCKVISKREYVNKNNEKYYYVNFLINDAEREFLVPIKNYNYLKEEMYGQITLLYDKVFLDFTIN